MVTLLQPLAQPNTAHKVLNGKDPVCDACYDVMLSLPMENIITPQQNTVLLLTLSLAADLFP